MTDNEIIKALEEHLQKCQNIKYGARQKILVNSDFLKDALNLINRQKAEIESLIINKNAFGLGMKRLAEDNKTIRAEAIKECAERLKEKTYPFPCAIGVENAVSLRAINDLVKEMTEVQSE